MSMSSHPPRRATAPRTRLMTAVAAGFVLAAPLAACSSDDGADAAGAAEPSTTVAATSSSVAADAGDDVDTAVTGRPTSGSGGSIPDLESWCAVAAGTADVISVADVETDDLDLVRGTAEMAIPPIGELLDSLDVVDPEAQGPVEAFLNRLWDATRAIAAAEDRQDAVDAVADVWRAPSAEADEGAQWVDETCSTDLSS